MAPIVVKESQPLKKFSSSSPFAGKKKNCFRVKMKALPHTKGLLELLTQNQALTVKLWT